MHKYVVYVYIVDAVSIRKPYKMRSPIHALGHPFVEECVLCAGVGVGSTELLQHRAWQLNGKL